MIKNEMIHLEDDVKVPKSEDLCGIAALAEKQVHAQETVADLENSLALEKEKLRRISEEELPESMIALGLKSFTLSNGNKLDVKTFYRGNISEKNKEQAHDWLRDRGHADLIKNQVVCSFGKGEDHDALTLMGQLKELKYDYENKKSVHPSTLKAFVREQIERGKTLPLDMFGIHIGQRSEIRRQK